MSSITIRDETDRITLPTNTEGFFGRVPLSRLTQSGANVGQAPRWNGSAWVAADDVDLLSTTGSVVTVDEQLADSSLGDPASILLAQSEFGFLGPPVIRPRKLSATAGDIGKVVGLISDGVGLYKFAMVTAAGGLSEPVTFTQPVTFSLGANLIQYPPGITPATALTDAAYAAILPGGTTANYRTIKSWRPESLPPWNETVAVTNNPSGSVPDVVWAAGWNNGGGSSIADATKPGAWSAWECFYAPDTNHRMELHLLETKWPDNRYWNGARRMISAEVFRTPGGGYGVPCDFAFDAETAAFRSFCPSQVAFGGEARAIGSDHAVISNNYMTGETALTLSSRNLANEFSLFFQANKNGYGMIFCDRTLYIRSGGGNVNIGDNARFEGSVGFYGGSPAAKPTVTGSRGANAALTSLLTGLAGLGLLTDSSS